MKYILLTKYFSFGIGLLASLIFISVSYEAFAQKPEQRCNLYWRVQSFSSQTEAKGSLKAKSNSSCKTTVNGYIIGGSWVFHGMSVVKQPTNGKLMKIGKFGLRFRPDADFVGKDYAEWKIIVRHTGSNSTNSVLIRTAIKVR